MNYDKQIALIIFIVAKRYKVDYKELTQKGRKEKIAEARYAAINITEKLYGGILSMKHISLYFGKEDHARVYAARYHLQDKHDTIKGFQPYFDNTLLICKNAVRYFEKFMERKAVKIQGYEYIFENKLNN